MRIVLTAHARERCEERGVKPEWIDRTLAEPDWVEPDPSDPDAKRWFKAGVAGDGRVLRVAARVEKDAAVVITAFFDRGARRTRSET
ncbi:MAG: DUF4258 domain-containing protein [Oceanicaulis sp.]